MSRLEYLLAGALLRIARVFFSRLKVRRNRVVLATARVSTLDGNLLHIHRAMVERHPELDYVLLLEPYSYGLAGKLAYLVRLVRGMYHLQTAGLFVIDNAYLPVHVAPHRPTTTVVQVWHAAGALKRFGLDTTTPLAEPERTFLHRYYDAVVVGGEWTRAPYAAALRTPIERVLALGSPRTDFFFDEEALAAARARVLAAHPALAGRRVVLYAPTFRGRGAGKRAAPGMDAPKPARRAARGPRAGPEDPPEPRPRRDRDGRLRRRRRSDRRHQRPAGPDRHPDHRLLVVDRRVRPARPADHPARRRPRRRTRSTPGSTWTTGPR